MKIIDTRGLTCPAPLIKTRQGLNESSPDESVQVIIDNQTSLNNIKRFMTDNRLSFSVKEEGEIWMLTVNRGEETEIRTNELEYCDAPEKRVPVKRNTVVAISSDKMGAGDDELGSRLFLTFFKMLVLLEPAPASIVFYNSGVKLAMKGSQTLEYIKELSEKGTGIYLCTTCINHFSLKEMLPVGSFSDMYQILNILNDADHIIRP